MAFSEFEMDLTLQIFTTEQGILGEGLVKEKLLDKYKHRSWHWSLTFELSLLPDFKVFKERDKRSTSYVFSWICND